MLQRSFTRSDANPRKPQFTHKLLFCSGGVYKCAALSHDAGTVGAGAQGENQAADRAWGDTGMPD